MPELASVPELKERVRRRLLDERDPSLFDGSAADKRLRLREAVRRVLLEDRVVLPGAEIASLVREISDEVVGLGPLEVLLRDPQITEVMINGPRDIRIERGGRIEKSEVVLQSDDQIMHLIDRVIGPLGLRVDESQPFVEARLPDGSRLHAIIPPLSVKGPVVTIRKFAVLPFTLADLISNRTMSRGMAKFLDGAVKAKVNMVVSGGTGSGKTTLLNVLSGSIPEGERLITIEEAAELRLARDHVVSLEARPANIEGTGEVTVRDLVRNALRMRPDRIIVGEVRGGEALDMLQAMNTGHEGSLSTCHANSPRDVLVRLETMVMMAELGLPPGPIRQQIASALDVIVHTTRFPDGSRKVVRVSEIRGLTEHGLELVDVFRFNATGVGLGGKVQGKFIRGEAPHALRRIEASGIKGAWVEEDD
ncbi:MAG TPA: CpaF family protein [Actinomycetota bacterium]|nr:CpaF family protein [Actinomycetota bacterium]